MFDVILLTFAIEIKHHAEFESCLRNHRNYPVSVKDTGFFLTLYLVLTLKCFILHRQSLCATTVFEILAFRDFHGNWVEMIYFANGDTIPF